MTYLVDVRPIVETVDKPPCRDGFCGFTMPINKTFSDYAKAWRYVMPSVEHALDHRWYISADVEHDSVTENLTIVWVIEEANGDLYEIELGGV